MLLYRTILAKSYQEGLWCIIVSFGDKKGGGDLCRPLLLLEYSRPIHVQYTQVIACLDSEKVSPIDSKYSCTGCSKTFFESFLMISVSCKKRIYLL